MHPFTRTRTSRHRTEGGAAIRRAHVTGGTAYIHDPAEQA